MARPHNLNRKKVRTCECGKRIHFIRMATGGTMPAEELRHGDGRISLVVLDDTGLGHVVPKAGRDVVGREPHWGNCSTYRRAKEAPNAKRLNPIRPGDQLGLF